MDATDEQSKIQTANDEVTGHGWRRRVLFALGATVMAFIVRRVTRNASAAAQDKVSPPAEPEVVPHVNRPEPHVIAPEPHLTGEPTDENLLGEAAGPLQRSFEGGNIEVGDVLPGVDTTQGRGRS